MNRTIELNLERLIPRHSGALPRELKDLTSSLLAQSRTKCNLGAEEEVARIYLCANLACERLKTTLNLPPIETHPPIAPRAYTKLYKYFDIQLQTSTARAKAQRSATSTPSRALPQRGTPSKEQSFKSFTASTPTKSTPASTYRTPKRGLKHISKTEKENKIPKWVIPAIRFVCKEMATPKASPHITAGVETLLTLPCPRPEIEAFVSEEKGNGKVAALIASVWFFVVVEMRGREGKGVESSHRQARVRDVLNRVREGSFMIERVGEDDSEWKGWEEIGPGDVLIWNKEIGGRGWKEMDWFLNVPEGTGVEGEILEEDDAMEELGEQEESESVGEDDDKFVGERVGRKTDTMHQGKYDYLSAKNRAEYKVWKEGILALLKQKGKQRIDVDTAMVDA